MPPRVRVALFVLPAAVCGLVALGLSFWGASRATGAGEDLPVEQAAHVFFTPVTISGRGPFWLTVDTGATLTVIDPQTAETLGLATRDAGVRANVGLGPDVTSLATARPASLDVGGRAFRPDPFYVLGVKAAERHLAHRIDGVLGTDFLRRHVVEFDYRAGRVRLHARPPSCAGDHVPLRVEGNVPTVVATLTLPDGRVLRPRLLIDTGSSGGLSLNSLFVQQHALEQVFPAIPGTGLNLRVSVGVNGVTTSRVVSFASFAIGAARLDRPDVALSAATEGLAASPAFDGILGADLLRHFQVVLDYPSGRLWATCWSCQ